MSFILLLSNLSDLREIESLWLLMLEDFNSHTETTSFVVVQDARLFHWDGLITTCNGLNLSELTVFTR